MNPAASSARAAPADSVAAELFPFDQTPPPNPAALSLDIGAHTTTSSSGTVSAHQHHSLTGGGTGLAPPPPPPPARSAAAAAAATSGTAAGGDAAKSLLDQAAQLLLQGEDAGGTAEDEAAAESYRVQLLAALNQAYATANARCDKLEGEILAKKRQLSDAVKLRYALQTFITKGSNASTSSTTSEDEGEDRVVSSSAAAGRRPRKSAVAKPAQANKRTRQSTGEAQYYDSEDEEYNSDDDDAAAAAAGGGKEKSPRMSSGACPECGKLRHRDKKGEPNICPFLLWTRDFGKQVPKRAADENILVTQKHVWPSVKKYFVDAEGNYVKPEGSKWNGPLPPPTPTSSNAE